LEKTPVWLGKNKIIFEDNQKGEPYFVFDAAAEVPLGPGMKVEAKKALSEVKHVRG
jgi:hypothetical protein